MAAVFVRLACGDLLDRRGMFAAVSLTHTCYAASFHALAFLTWFPRTPPLPCQFFVVVVFHVPKKCRFLYFRWFAANCFLAEVVHDEFFSSVIPRDILLSLFIFLFRLLRHFRLPRVKENLVSCGVEAVFIYRVIRSQSVDYCDFWNRRTWS